MIINDTILHKLKKWAKKQLISSKDQIDWGFDTNYAFQNNILLKEFIKEIDKKIDEVNFVL